MKRKKIITRIKGGLGNQLFCYASARRLALINDAELVIDDVSGFLYDKLYKRKYALDAFNIPFRKATWLERKEPLGRLRRFIVKWLDRNKTLPFRRYIQQNGVEFDGSLLDLKFNFSSIYFDGFGQSESYFCDIQDVIRQELSFKSELDHFNQTISDEIQSVESVAIHIRLFDSNAFNSLNNLSKNYYEKAIDVIFDKVTSPNFYIFSDDVSKVEGELLHLFRDAKVTFLHHNNKQDQAHLDLRLMSLCKHIVIANSTFSWWAAWLGEGKGKGKGCVIAPYVTISPDDNKTAWGFKGLLPERWTLL